MTKKTDEFITYVTRRIVTYVTTPKEARNAVIQTKQTREPLMTRWFGILPMAFGLMLKPKSEEPQVNANAGETLGQG